MRGNDNVTKDVRKRVKRSVVRRGVVVVRNSFKNLVGKKLVNGKQELREEIKRLTLLPFAINWNGVKMW